MSEIPYFKLNGMVFGLQIDRDKYHASNQEVNFDFEGMARECLYENPQSYWVLFRSDDQFPLEHGPFETRFEMGDHEESISRYNKAGEKYNIKSPVILVYYQYPNTLERVQNAKQHLIRSKEESIVQNLKDQGLI